MSIFSSLFGKKRKVLLVNDTITVTLKNGAIFIFENADKNLYDIIMSMQHDGEVEDLYFEMIPEEAKIEIAKEEQIKKEYEEEVNLHKELTGGLQSLIDTGDFEVEDDIVRMKGIPLSIPVLLVKKFVSVLTNLKFDGKPTDDEMFDEYFGLKNFWKWCSLNPNAHSREHLFKFLEKHDLKINRNGMFFAYRRVVTRDTSETTNNKELVAAISNSYVKIKGQKKGPGSFELFEDLQTKDYFYNKVGAKINTELHPEYLLVGNVKELYEGLDAIQEDKAMFTDAHTRTFDIKIGEEVSIDPKLCDWSADVACSKGLHVGNKNFLFGGFGDTPILVMVNPMKVIAVPHGDTNKMRVQAYFPIAILTQEEEAKFLESNSVMELGNEYFQEQIEELNEMVKNNTPEELAANRLTINLPANVLMTITDSLEVAKETLAKRTVNID